MSAAECKNGAGGKVRAMKNGRVRTRRSACLYVMCVGFALGHALAAPQRFCQRVTLQGEVNSGQQWQASLGQGWVFRILPIPPLPEDYSGWDLVVDRDPPAGYPDALLLATLPYNSINEREIATTFGLRAQDAIGWNPRSFHFLTGVGQFRQAQQWFRQIASGGPNAA